MTAEPPRFPYLEVDVSEPLADDVAYALMELGASGVELRDDTTLTRGPGGGTVRLVASFDDRSGAEAAASALTRAHVDLAPRVDEVVGDDWRERYKEHFKPFALTPRLVVAPPWVERPAAERVLVMDPGRAFGTGLHATTSLVARQLDEDADRYRDGHVLDVGTGSGVLALVALLFGARAATAIDDDPDVIAIALENAARNGLSHQIEVSTRPVADLDECHPYVVANIRAPVLIDMSDALRARVAPGGRLVLSGILESEAFEVKTAFIARGFTVAAEHRREEPPHPDAWVAIVLEG